MKWIVFWSFTATLFALPVGKRVFDAQCAPCHGIGGAGGRGPNLARIRRANTEAGLKSIIAEGIPGTEMPKGWMLSEKELAEVTAYVQSLGSVAREQVSGDAAHGKIVYEGSGCPSCHIAQGAGRAYGPELTEIGARRSAAYLREAILKPDAAVPEGFLMVKATRLNKEAVTGIRINEDSFTIQILDFSARQRSFRKAELANLEKLTGKTPMPAYQGKDADDLVAYLVSLRGAL